MKFIFRWGVGGESEGGLWRRNCQVTPLVSDSVPQLSAKRPRNVLRLTLGLSWLFEFQANYK